MKVEIINESGYKEALLGISLSYRQPLEKMPEVAAKLAHEDGGHNKFLESICVWLDLTLSRKVWQQFDTYRVGVTKQSESTMHTLLNRPLVQGDFEMPIFISTLQRLNRLIENGQFEQVKNELPEGFLQRRIVCTNYKALRHIIGQRLNHKLPEWSLFCEVMFVGLEHPEFVMVEEL